MGPGHGGAAAAHAGVAGGSRGPDGIRGRVGQAGYRSISPAQFPPRFRRRLPAGRRAVLRRFWTAHVHRIRIQTLAHCGPAGGYDRALAEVGLDGAVRHRGARAGESHQGPDAADDAVSLAGSLQTRPPFRDPGSSRARHGLGERGQDGAQPPGRTPRASRARKLPRRAARLPRTAYSRRTAMCTC